MKLIKGLFKLILFLVFLVLIAIIGVFVYFKVAYDINLLTVGSSLSHFNEKVDETTLVTNPYTNEDLLSSKSILKKSSNIIVDDGDGYKFDFSNIGLLTSDIKLSDREVAAYASEYCKSEMDNKITYSNYELTFEILQIEFLNIVDGNTNFNVIIKLDISSIKKSLNFPLNYINKFIPQYIYISSTVHVENNGGISYTTTPVAIGINNLTDEELTETFKILTNIAKIGTLEEFNLFIGSCFVDALIGNSENEGLTYKLKNNTFFVKGYKFIKENETNYFIIERGIL